MTSERPISNSEISTFLQCRRKWWLTYYRQVKPKPKGKGPLALGTRVHEALSAYYSVLRQSPLEVYTRGVIRDRKLVDERDQADFEKEAELGRIMLDGYFDWVKDTGADAGLTVISDEEELEGELPVDGYKLVGKLDLRVRRDLDGAKLFMDHKTTASLTAPLQTLQQNPQMLTYHVLEMLNREPGDRCDGALYNQLKKVKRTARANPPFYSREEIRHNIIELRNFWLRLVGIVSEVKRLREKLDRGENPQVVAYPTPTTDCTWKCDHWAVCPLFDDGSHAEGLIEATYVTENPYERYKDVT